MNQQLLRENQHLKKDFHEAEHWLKTLLAEKRIYYVDSDWSQRLLTV